MQDEINILIDIYILYLMSHLNNCNMQYAQLYDLRANISTTQIKFKIRHWWCHVKHAKLQWSVLMTAFDGMLMVGVIYRKNRGYTINILRANNSLAWFQRCSWIGHSTFLICDSSKTMQELLRLWDLNCFNFIFHLVVSFQPP